MIVKCPDCGSKGSVGDDHAGQLVRCAQCGAKFSANQQVGEKPDSKWYYAEQNEKKGPIDQNEFDRLVAIGDIGPETLVWRKGMSGWHKLASVMAEGTQPGSVGKLAKQGSGGEVTAMGKSSIARPKLPFAGWGKRFPAKIIDLIFMFAVASMVEGLSRKLFPEAYATGDLNQVYLITTVLDMLLGIFYITWFIGKYGATPGKMVFNLKVVTATGGKVGYGRAFARYCGEFLAVLGLSLILAVGFYVLSQNMASALVVLLAFIFLCYLPIVFDSQRRGLPDYLCRTRVVQV